MHVLQTEEYLTDPQQCEDRPHIFLRCLTLCACSGHASQQVPAMAELHDEHVEAHICEVVRVEELYNAGVWNLPDSLGHFEVPRGNRAMAIHHRTGVPPRLTGSRSSIWGPLGSVPWF